MDIFLNIHLQVETEFFLKNKKEIFNNITEIINNTNSVTFKINYIRALKEKPNDEKVKKKRVTFDDILTNMNLVVNKTGVLQFMTPSTQIQEVDSEEYNYNQKPILKNTTYNAEPANNSVNHSYIYNKYFKDYQQTYYEEPVIRVPKTMEEYKQMLLDDRLREIQERKRISEIKSRKLMFTTNQDPMLNGKNIQPSKNNLRKMSFM
jgi:hypothetical protein